MNAGRWLEDTRISYDEVAASYADQLRDALDGKLYIRAALALFADMVRDSEGGPVADLGCGSGHVTAHLRELGINAFGIDLPPAMIDVARRDYPGLRFEVGSMTDLRLADASLGFHAGEGSRLKTEGYGSHPMRVYVHRRRPDQVAAWLRAAGITVEAQMLVGPDDNVPAALLFARRQP